MDNLMKQPGPPSEGVFKDVYLDGKTVKAEIFNTQDMDGMHQYAIIRSPNFVSVRKLS